MENYQEAILIRGVDIIPVKNLQEVGEFISKNIVKSVQEKIVYQKRKRS